MVSFDLGAKGWTWGLVGSASPGGSPKLQAGKALEKSGDTTLLREGVLDCWIDDQNRARIQVQDGKLSALGLIRCESGAIVQGEATTTADGGASLKITRTFSGMAQGLRQIQTFELPPGAAALACRNRWEFPGPGTRWIAYTGNGGAIAARWGALLSGTMVQRVKSPDSGEMLGASLIRLGWFGPAAGVESVTTGYGIAATVMDSIPSKLMAGSMVWTFSKSGGRWCLVDPVHGQFPFAVTKDQPVENGIVFQATQAGINVQPVTQALARSVTSGKGVPSVKECAVFVAGRPVAAQPVVEIPATARSLWLVSGEVRRAAVTLNAAQRYRFQIATAGKVAVRAVPLENGKAVPLTLTTEGGLQLADVNEQLRWTGIRSFVLEVTAPAAATPELVLRPSIGPTLLAPAADADLTDVAVSFRWKALANTIDYEVELVQEEDFARAYTLNLRSSAPFPLLIPEDRDLPTAGAWRWRVRGISEGKPGEWSEVRTMKVNADHSLQPLDRPVTPERPLFTLEALRVTDYTTFNPEIPEDLRPHLGIIAENYVGRGVPMDVFARGMDQQPYAIMLRGFGPSYHEEWAAPADYEYLFQHAPNCIGIQGGESLNILYEGAIPHRYAQRLLVLCAKYGKIYHEADGTYGSNKWEALMAQAPDVLKTYGPYLILSQKNNIARRQFVTMGSTLGLWLAGATHQHAAWEDGGFYWQNAGFSELGQCAGERKGDLSTMPGIFWTLNFAQGLARGCAMFCLDGQTLMVPGNQPIDSPELARAGIWNPKGQMTPNFHRHVVPFIRAVIQQHLIPSRAEVLAGVKLAVVNDHPPADASAWPNYLEYGPLFATTYGFGAMGAYPGESWEFFPNTGRYGTIPILPGTDLTLPAGIRRVPLSQVMTPATVKSVFDAAYPAWYTGTATVYNPGNTLVAMNHHENADTTVTYGVPFTAGPVQRIGGDLPPHSYLLGRRVTGAAPGLWLQVDGEYPNRPICLRLTCSRRPEPKVVPAEALTATTWDMATSTLTLTLSTAMAAPTILIP